MIPDPEFIAGIRARVADLTAFVAEYDAPPPPPPVPERYRVEAGASLSAALGLEAHTRYLVEGERTEACLLLRPGLDLEFAELSGVVGTGNEVLSLAMPDAVIVGGRFCPGEGATGATVVEAGLYGSGTTGTHLSYLRIDGAYRTAHGLALHTTGVVRGLTIRHVALPSRETHGIWGNDIPDGGLTIEEFDIEAAGVGIFLGGAVFHLGHVPRGVTIRRGAVRKLDAWKQRLPDGTYYVVKNSIEFKGVEGALIEDVLIDGNWRQGQDGDTVLLKAESQYGAEPFLVAVRDVTLRRVTIRNASGGISIGGPNPTYDRDASGAIIRTKPNGGTSDVTIEDCELHIDKTIVGFQNRPGSGRALQVQGPVPNLKVRRSVFDTNGSSCLYYVGEVPSPGAEFVDSTFEHGIYGFTGDHVVRRGDVVELLAKRFPDAVWQGNTVNVRQRADGSWPFARYPEGTNVVRMPYQG